MVTTDQETVPDTTMEEATSQEQVEGPALYTEILNLSEEREAANNLCKSSKSLAQLMTVQPHLSLSTPGLPADLLSSLEPEAGQPAPISYLTPDQLDDYLSLPSPSCRNILGSFLRSQL